MTELADEQIKAVIVAIDPDEQYMPKALMQFARAIIAAMRMVESATCTAEIEDALDAFELASGPEEMARLINYIDGLQAEIARLKSDNARLLSDVTRPESLDVGLMRAEIGRLSKDAARYQWLKKHPQWLGWEHDFRPDEVEREIDAAMKETP